MMLSKEKLLYCNYPEGTDGNTLKRIASFNIFLAIYVILSVSFGILHLALSNYLLASVLLVGSVIICGARALMCLTRNHEAAFTIAAILAMLLLLTAYISGGIHNYGPLWFVAFPMAALVLLGPLKGTIASLSLIVLSLLLQVAPFSHLMRTSYDPVFLFMHASTYLIVFLLALTYELQKAKAGKEIKELKGLIPICASCKNIRDDRGYWNQIEGYIQKNSDVMFSHSICPECAKKLYPPLK
ncbi:MAG: hypothetical protein P8Z37_01110 [Acidobacteriota bacterium]|jgi:hypothetical protein